MTHRQRVELTKHEVASAASAGVWFETILMQMLIRFYYDADPTSRHAQYALTEIADECRHSIMFGRLIERTGCPVYPPRRIDHQLGRFLKATARGPHMYSAILIAEELLDSFQREIMTDESLQPLIRVVSRIHVIEESRHVRFAQEELARQVEATGWVGLAYSRLVIGRAAYSVARRLVHPRVYAAVGIDPAAGAAAAQANPHFHATLRPDSTALRRDPNRGSPAVSSARIFDRPEDVKICVDGAALGATRPRVASHAPVCWVAGGVIPADLWRHALRRQDLLGWHRPQGRPARALLRTRQLYRMTPSAIAAAATAADTAGATRGSSGLGTIASRLRSGRATSAIALAAASFMPSVIRVAPASSAPRKMPGNASTLLI